MTRAGYVMTAVIAAVSIGLAATVPITPRLVWNASASLPIGFYTIAPATRLEPTDLVVVSAPEPLAAFLAERGYLPRSVPLLKRVAGLPGQEVCRRAAHVTVDGIDMGDARARDRLGRELPVWQGCRRVADDEIFLMNWWVEDSLDGRYFGPLPRASILGRAMPLWTDEEATGQFEWRAPTR